MVDVVAALIWRGEAFLICQRPAGKARGLLWEFAGGKVESGETPQQALVRECREELDIIVHVGEEFMQVTHAYPDITVRLTLFCAQIVSGEPRCLEHAALRWIRPEEIPQYDFCPADAPILASALALALGIGIQNFPEGAALSLPMWQDGKGAARAFGWSAASGAVEPVFGVLAAMAVGSVAVLMPWLLAFAAGAMMYVVVEELIPEAASRAGTLGAMFGFLVMMALDVALG